MELSTSSKDMLETPISKAVKKTDGARILLRSDSELPDLLSGKAPEYGVSVKTLIWQDREKAAFVVIIGADDRVDKRALADHLGLASASELR